MYFCRFKIKIEQNIMSKHQISIKFLGLEKIDEILKNDSKLSLSDESSRAIEQCRSYLIK